MNLHLLSDRRVLLPVLVTAVAIAVGAVLIVLLGDDTSSSVAPAPAASQTAAGGAVAIDIADFKYEPVTVTVDAGAKVSWVNRDAAPHTATASDVFDTGILRKGDAKSLTLDKAGTYDYVCDLHPFMKATVIVR